MIGSRLWCVLFTIPLVVACNRKEPDNPRQFASRYDQAWERVENCQYIEARHNLWAAMAGGSGALAGASGLSTLAFDDDQKKEKRVVASIGVVAGVVAAVSAALIPSYKSSYELRKCSTVYDDLKAEMDNPVGPAPAVRLQRPPVAPPVADGPSVGGAE